MQSKRVILLKERDKYNVQHSSLDKNREDWAQMAVAVFNFAAKAQEKFATGNLETKRDICKIFGTSMILNGKKARSFIQNAVYFYKRCFKSHRT